MNQLEIAIAQIGLVWTEWTPTLIVIDQRLWTKTMMFFSDSVWPTTWLSVGNESTQTNPWSVIRKCLSAPYSLTATFLQTFSNSSNNGTIVIKKLKQNAKVSKLYASPTIPTCFSCYTCVNEYSVFSNHISMKNKTATHKGSVLKLGQVRVDSTKSIPTWTFRVANGSGWVGAGTMVSWIWVHFPKDGPGSGPGPGRNLLMWIQNRFQLHRIGFDSGLDSNSITYPNPKTIKLSKQQNH